MSVTTITRTYDSTPTDKTYFSLTDNMSSSSLGNIQTPQNSQRISRIDVSVDAADTKGFVLAGRLLGSNMSEQNLTLAGSCGDSADAGATTQFNMIPTNFSVVGVNNIDLQVAFQFSSGTPTASSLSVTLYFE